MTCLRLVRAATIAMALVASGAGASDYPSKPIRIIVPFASGSGTDVVARTIGEALSSQMGVSVVVENVVGAGGNIGSSAVAKAAADGYTLLSTANPLTVTPHMQKVPPFDPAKDFSPIARITVIPMVLVTGMNSRHKSFEGLVQEMRSHPGKVTYATSGKGAPSHLEVELLEQHLNVNAQDLPYRVGGQAITDVIGSQVDFFFANLPIALPQLKAGNMRALAVGSVDRIPAMADVPTLAELLKKPGYEASVWYGLSAPGGTPPEIVSRLENEVRKALENPQVRTKLEGVGGQIALVTSKAFGEQIRAENDKWRKIVKDLNLTAD